MEQISMKVMSDVGTDGTYLTAYTSITIVDNKGKYVISRFGNERGSFTKINLNPRLTLKYEPRDKKWDVSRQITFSRKYIFRFQMGLKHFYNHLQKGLNYIYDNDGYLQNVVKDKSDVMIISTDHQWISFEPDMLYVNQLKLPGVLVTMNAPENVVIISIDEYESICASLSNMDLNIIGSSMLSIYESSKGRDMESREAPKTNNVTNAKNIFDKQESVGGPIMVNNSNKSLFDI